jgi:hypothetical protein
MVGCGVTVGSPNPDKALRDEGDDWGLVTGPM